MCLAPIGGTERTQDGECIAEGSVHPDQEWSPRGARRQSSLHAALRLTSSNVIFLPVQ